MTQQKKNNLEEKRVIKLYKSKNKNFLHLKENMERKDHREVLPNH